MEFITFEIAKKLKEKGFPQHECDYGYIEKDDKTYRIVGPGIPDYLPNTAAPTLSQVLKWLREEHHLHFEVIATAYGYNLIISDIPDKGGSDRYYSHINDDGPNYIGGWDKYEDCILYGIEYVLDNLI